MKLEAKTKGEHRLFGEDYEAVKEWDLGAWPRRVSEVST
jgi:hypothetical protein